MSPASDGSNAPQVDPNPVLTGSAATPTVPRCVDPDSPIDRIERIVTTLATFFAV